MSLSQGILLICISICLSSAINVNHPRGDNVLHFEIESDVQQKEHENLGTSVGNSSCSNPTYFCSNNRTCCKGSKNITFACCPFPQGVCCLDGIHCCPQNTKCDMAKRVCYRDTYSGREILTRFEDNAFTLMQIPHRSESSLKVIAPEVKSVVCPDGASQCPDGNTCCLLASGSYGCCPVPKAVCCSDHVHCCPSGYKCDTSSGECTRGNDVIEWLKKEPAKALTSEVGDVQCDSTHSCPSGNTCCKLSSGQWGCCPVPQAVCCADHIHCCPNGYTCATGQCTKGNDVIEWLQKEPAKALTSEVGDVQCDSTHSCPSGNTCCKLSSGQWGCCPVPQAVCCADHLHCCPNGYKCATSTGQCTRGNDVIEWLQKDPAKALTSEVGDVQCDSTHSCPSGNTCCKLSSGQWGCCPVPQAVCCADHLHCCPNGYKCATSTGQCTRGNDVIEWLQKEPAKALTSEVGDVQCDSTHSCPSGNTCCKLSSGQWGCCPVPQAVCCADHLHCCPNGYKCATSTGQCTRGNDVIEWLQKEPAKALTSEVGDVQCDSTHSCPSGNTCCKLSSGQWGCCPVPQAVCCADHLHCCPNGYKCATSTGQCTRGNDVIEWLQKEPAKALTSEVGDVQCDSTHSCPSGNTCCKLSSGQWGCCPVPQAVCCADHLHCCPNGYKCATSTGQCTRGNDVIEWLQKEPAKALTSEVDDVQCDSTHSCPSGNTCCKLSSGQWGCCPVPQAVCCADHLHCCPNGYKCATSTGQCTRGNDVIEWLQKEPAKALTSEVGDVQCDSTHSCPSGNTCCKLSSGQWGCCPVPQAVCCADHIHCCPNGYTCATGQCTKGNDVIEWLQKEPAKALTSEVGDVQCDSTHYCPSGNTCCKLSSGQWGCCPVPQAVCCADHLHCCPNGYKCATSTGQCTRGNDVIEWLQKEPAKALTSEVGDVQCDSTHSCPSGNTCCKLSSGQWGCCPVPQAVCCADHLHCCPNGYKCATSTGQCTRGNDVIEWLQKEPAKALASEVGDVQCDSTHSCPSGNTCCKLSSGQWGCCPVPQAVCCADHIHCCPNGYKCATSTGQCTRGNDVIEWLQKEPAKTLTSAVGDVQCDSTHSCPSGNTCCKLSSGQWGCCPVPQAVCCADHLHCCPNGYKCATSTGQCTRGNDVIEWLQKEPALTSEVNSVVCPDGASQCPDGNTCCLLASGSYGCCPVPKAVCCADHVHCCPDGYKCSASTGQCTRGNDVIEWLQKEPAKALIGGDSVQCDASHYCPDGNTCCKMASDEWGCCPSPQAVCCADHIHCCPNGYQCDVSSGTCMRGRLTLPWLSKQMAKVIENP